MKAIAPVMAVALCMSVVTACAATSKAPAAAAANRKAPSSSAANRNAPSPATATAAFARLLHRRYGAVHGYWTCPEAQTVNGRISCFGEVRAGRTWYQLGADATFAHSRLVFVFPFHEHWHRHWWPYSRRFILRSHEGQTPGVISVNSPAYDWGFLAVCAHSLYLHGRAGRCSGLDSDSSGLFRFYRFACSGTRVVICRNRLGDEMRYRPT